MTEMLRALDGSVRAESGSSAKSTKSNHNSQSEVLKASEAVPDLIPIRTAIATVSDKTGLPELAKALAKFQVEMIATTGTATHLESLQPHGLKLTNLENYTAYPENLNGRLKTLHPKIQAGVLAIKGYHDSILEKENVQAKYIELVIVNLYPFEKTASQKASFYECIENIDIGGPALLRAAAKNHSCVAAVCDPSDYPELIRELEENHGKTTRAFRRKCALKVFELTSNYDKAIAKWLRRNL